MGGFMTLMFCPSGARPERGRGGPGVIRGVEAGFLGVKPVRDHDFIRAPTGEKRKLKELNDEKDLSTEQDQAEPDSRFPEEDEDRRRPQDIEAQAAEGAEEAHGLQRKAAIDRAPVDQENTILAAPEKAQDQRYKTSKKEILRGRRNFKDLFRQGRVVTVRYLRVVFRENGLDHNRIAVSIGKRHGKSHERNYMRRVIKEIIRTNKGTARSGHDMSVIVRDRKFSGMSFDEKSRMLLSCLGRV